MLPLDARGRNGSLPEALVVMRFGSCWVYLEEYTLLTAANCGSFSTATSFLEFTDARAVVDAAGHTAIVWLAWSRDFNWGVPWRTQSSHVNCSSERFWKP